MTKPEIIKLADDIEDFVASKIDMNTFDSDFHKVVKVLSNRHIEPELDLNLKHCVDTHS